MCDGGVKSALSFAVQRSRRIAKRAKRGGEKGAVEGEAKSNKKS